jgi:hypothetical protein
VRRKFIPRRQDVRGNWREARSVELHYLLASQYGPIIMVMKYVAMGEACSK